MRACHSATQSPSTPLPHPSGSKNQILSNGAQSLPDLPCPPHRTSHARPPVGNLPRCAPSTTASWLLLQGSRLLLPWGTCAVLGKLSLEIPTAHPCLSLKFVLKCCLLWPSFLKPQPFWCPSIPCFTSSRALSSTFQQTTKLTFVLVLLHWNMYSEQASVRCHLSCLQQCQHTADAQGVC